MFREAEGYIALSHQLVTIKTDVPVEVTAADLAFTGKYQPLAADLFGKYEFGSLKKYIAGTVEAEPSERQSLEYDIVPSKGFKHLTAIGLGWSHGGEGLLLRAAAVKDGSVEVCDGDVPAQLLADPKVAKYGYGLKKLRNLLLEEGKTLEGRLYDIELMHYLLNPEQDHSAEVLSASLLGISINEEPQNEGGLFADVSKEEEEDVCRQAALCSLLGPTVLKELRDSSLENFNVL